MAKDNPATSEKENKAYELAYLLVPQLADEAAVSTVAEFIKGIEGLGGKLIAQDGPEMRELAYTISKVYTGKRTDYDSAYFGWVRFELPAASQGDLNEKIRNNKNVVRSMIISVSKSAPVINLKKSSRRQSGASKETETEKPEISSEEIDKQVDELIATTVPETVS